MGKLRAVIEQKVPSVPFAEFYTALSEVSRELGEVRTREMREFSSAHRFALILARVGMEDSAHTRKLAGELSLEHMKLLASATDIPSSHLRLLATLRPHYRIALVSNFDHALTARGILERDGAAAYFQHVTISEEHGWRKPHPQIFTDTLKALEVSPPEALFVGDSPHDDILGARGVGMDIAWVNAQEGDLPEQVPVPDYTVRAIPELQHL